MATWFSYNGVNSNNMGVILSTTPPIIRASKRYNQIYVDGKDGCEVDELGYNAYVKTVEIGLKEDADINKVMDWLTGEGKLILWNEPNVYYEGKILEQIDYSRLLRFHTAQVKFLCQPYKYSVTETSTTSTTVTIDSNCVQLPIIKVTGTGKITLKLNNIEICSVILSSSIPYLEMNSIMQDAYYNGALANRSMSGNFITLGKGSNVITYTGTVTKIETKYRMRWL